MVSTGSAFPWWLKLRAIKGMKAMPGHHFTTSYVLQFAKIFSRRRGVF